MLKKVVLLVVLVDIVFLAPKFFGQEKQWPASNYLLGTAANPEISFLWRTHPFLNMPSYNDYENVFWGKKRFIRLNVINIKPDQKIWPTSRKIFYADFEGRWLVEKNVWLGLTGQWYNSFYKSEVNNWQVGPMIKFILPQQNSCLEVHYLQGMREGRYDKRIVLNWQVNLNF